MDMTTNHLTAYLMRTEAGRAECRARAAPLSRSARNLLMVIDASCSGEEWVRKVQGSSVADLQQLFEAGLVAPQVAAPSQAAQPGVPVEVAVGAWTYDALYTLLTHEAKERFGLIKGYRLILKIESCKDLADMQKLALEFVEQIRKVHGEEPSARFRRVLGASD